MALSQNFNPNYINNRMSSLTVAVTETKQGLYKEYVVDKVDDRYLDDARSTYKTADQTEENKTKVCSAHVSFTFESIFNNCYCSTGHFLACCLQALSSSPWFNTIGMLRTRIK